MANIRKEQVLFLLSLGVAAWIGLSMQGARRVKKANPRAKPEETVHALDPILASPSQAPKNLRELFVEPSESRPLEPKQDLPFPGLRRLPVVLLPLPVGQRPGALHGLRRWVATKPLESKKPNGQQGGGDPGNGNGNAAPAPVPGGDDAELRYDAVVKHALKQPYWGLFLGSEEEKFAFALDRSKLVEGVAFEFQWVDPKTGKRLDVMKFKGEEVKELRLAKTLRNEVGMRGHRLVPASHNVEAQRQFILWLIEQGQKEAWVFEEALSRAKTYQKFATPKEEGLLYVAKVLRAVGDLPAEWKLFKDLDQGLQGSSFQARGLGVVEARLGLDRRAEEHLRRAVQKNEPIDPRNYAALARFLLDRGRSQEAVPLAEKAVSFSNRRDPTIGEKVAFRGLLVRAYLAVGRLDDAERVKDGVSHQSPALIEQQRYQVCEHRLRQGPVRRRAGGFPSLCPVGADSRRAARGGGLQVRAG